MILAARESLTADIVHELLAARFRVLVLTGWSEPPPGVPSHDENEHVMLWKEAPHDWVFNRANLVVHHGGAGTTGRALASGVPSIIIPVLRWADQMHWGNLVETAGVGVVIRQHNPDRALIRRAVHRAQRGTKERAPFSGSIIGDRANALGSVVRAEMSCEGAVTALESCLCNLILPPDAADAIHPLAGAIDVAALSPEQRMCLRNCIPCRLLRSRLPALGLCGPPAGDAATAATQRVPPSAAPLRHVATITHGDASAVEAPADDAAAPSAVAPASRPSPRASVVPPRRLESDFTASGPAEPRSSVRPAAPSPAAHPGRRSVPHSPISAAWPAAQDVSPAHDAAVSATIGIAASRPRRRGHSPAAGGGVTVAGGNHEVSNGSISRGTSTTRSDRELAAATSTTASVATARYSLRGAKVGKDAGGR